MQYSSNSISQNFLRETEVCRELAYNEVHRVCIRQVCLFSYLSCFVLCS